MPTDVQSPMPLPTDVTFPPEWAMPTGNPFPGSPLQVANDPNFASGYTPSVKLPGMTTPSGNLYAAAGVALVASLPPMHTAVQITAWGKKMSGTALAYDTFGARTGTAASYPAGTANGKIGPSPASVLQTGAYNQRFSGLPDPNTGSPAGF